MGKIANGAKAGALAGIIYGIISAIFTIVSLILLKTEIINALNHYISSTPLLSGTKITAEQIYNAEFTLGPVAGVIGGIILGLILGLIFAYVYNRLPGSSGKVKGIVFGLIMWIILGALLGLASMSEYGTSYYLISDIVGAFIAAIVYGYLMGILFSRFEAAEAPVQSEPAYPKL